MIEKIKYLTFFSRRNFTVFWIGLLSFSLADALYNMSLNWWILETLQSETEMGIVGMFNFIPMFVFGLFSGVIIDLFNRKRLLIISASSRGFFIFFIPLLNFFQMLEVWHLYIIAFLQGTSFTFFHITASATIPQLVDEKDLMAANSLVDVCYWSANTVGFLTGGIMIVSLGEMNLLTSATVLLCGSSLSFILIQSTFKKINASVSFRAVFTNLIDGFSTIRNDRAILTFILTWMGIQMLFAVGPMTIGWPVFSKKILNAGPQGYGLLIVAVSVSSIIGSILIGQWGGQRKKGHLIMIGFLWGSVGMIVLSLAKDLLTALIIALLWNFCYPLINIPFMTVIQVRAPKEELGRIYGVSNTLAAIMNPISIVLTGFIMEKFSVTLSFQLFALALGFCFIVVYFNKEARNA